MVKVDTEPKVLSAGSMAPDFKDVEATGDSHISLGDYRERFLIMVFYPKDQTPGCTKQLCALRDDMEQLKKLNTDVIAVNPDSLKSHEKFAAAQNYSFPILVDKDAKISEAYHALKPEGGIQRTVYIVGPDGTIIFGKQGMPSTDEFEKAIKEAQ